MPATLKLDIDQIIDLVKQMSSEEKFKLSEILRKEGVYEEFRKFRKEMKDIPVSYEEITKEVETVREKNYNSKFDR